MVPGTEQTCKSYIASMRKIGTAFPVFSSPQVGSRLGISPDSQRVQFQISKTRRELVTFYVSFQYELLILLLDMLVTDVNCQLKRIWNYLGNRHLETPVLRTVLTVLVEVGMS